MTFTASLLEYSSVVPLMAAQEFTALINSVLPEVTTTETPTI
jgi:hypothetical protein